MLNQLLARKNQQPKISRASQRKKAKRRHNHHQAHPVRSTSKTKKKRRIRTHRAMINKTNPNTLQSKRLQVKIKTQASQIISLNKVKRTDSMNRRRLHTTPRRRRRRGRSTASISHKNKSKVLESIVKNKTRKSKNIQMQS